MKAAVVGVAWLALVGCSDDPVSKDNFDIYKCEEASTNLPNGNHNPGMDCMGACHDHGFKLAGTVFMRPDSDEPAVGASVKVRYQDQAGAYQIMSMITASNGNFYTKEANFNLPARVWVTSCPDTELMPDVIDKKSDQGPGPSCNQAECHQSAGGTGHITLFQ